MIKFILFLSELIFTLNKSAQNFSSNDTREWITIGGDFCTQPIQMNTEMILKRFYKKNIILCVIQKKNWRFINERPRDK